MIKIARSQTRISAGRFRLALSMGIVAGLCSVVFLAWPSAMRSTMDKLNSKTDKRGICLCYYNEFYIAPIVWIIGKMGIIRPICPEYITIKNPPLFYSKPSEPLPVPPPPAFLTYEQCRSRELMSRVGNALLAGAGIALAMFAGIILLGRVRISK